MLTNNDMHLRAHAVFRSVVPLEPLWAQNDSVLRSSDIVGPDVPESV